MELNWLVCYILRRSLAKRQEDGEEEALCKSNLMKLKALGSHCCASTILSDWGRLSLLYPQTTTAPRGAECWGRPCQERTRANLGNMCIAHSLFISSIENGFGKKNHTIIICGPQKKEEKLAMFWEGCPALLWFRVVKLQHATCTLVWQSVCWSNVHSRPLTHLFHCLPELSLLMKSDWASWQVGVSSDVIVHYVSCNRFHAVQIPPFYFLKSDSQPSDSWWTKCQVTFDQVSSVFLWWVLDREALPLAEKSHLEI